MNRDVDVRLEELVQGLLHATELEMFDFKVNRHKKNISIRVLIDRPCGGITIEQCAQVNKAVQHKFDESGLIEQPYSLEISSPGADSRLKTRKDFLRVLNRDIRFVLTPMDNLKGEYIGTLKQVNDEDVVIIDGEDEVRIPFAQILKAQEYI